MKTAHTTNSEIIKHRRKLFVSTDDTISIERLSSNGLCVADHYHYHQSYELYYLCSGERYYFIRDNSYLVTAGTFVLINKYDIHYTTASANPEFDRILINLSDDFLSDILNISGRENLLDCFKKDIHTIQLEENDRPFAKKMLETLLQEYNEKKTFYITNIKAILLQLLVFINRNQAFSEKSIPDYVNAAHKTASDISGYINTHYNENISLEYLSEKYYLSKCYISRTFKKITGLSFVEYLNSVRIKEAQKLLLKTDLTVEEISESVGYNSITHFERIFKNSIGTTPLSYRKNGAGT